MQSFPYSPWIHNAKLIGWYFSDRYISLQLQAFDLRHKQYIIKIFSKAAHDCLCDRDAVVISLPF